ncbi:(2Fe-2S)-binding protein [Streptomyces albireticuli]|uniref:Iron-sulfur protein n=1 Tax=Streptomyces albireticuli TaxID=1940 RepID=A0A2A2D768_9ACTN|nr:(2Fe-2S)-binding protein [Streptomyces albireticuli]MCD9140669.1 (2Fe-2S)-binding protein [Streptomyces albireticuli]MCD9161369.1 (2Fe-2S)-binding protein [Streptomyces albireticuli]MCD9190573.1 (2Fe-2S)-binding protein [Streptomyces albireticuli]PAU48328.1 iron-sulfur protein [Streptomyces albireticuli]
MLPASATPPAGISSSAAPPIPSASAAVPDPGATHGSALVSSFSGAYARLAEALPHVTATMEPPRRGDGWLTAAGLAAGGDDLDAFLARDDEQLLRDYGARGRPEAVASLGLHRYAWPVCLLVTVPWFLLGRVPRLPVASVSLHRARGRMTAWPAQFACLPDDPAAELPGAVVVADQEALRAWAREVLAEHLTPLLEAFRPRMRRGPRALWGMATDEIAEGLWHVAGLLGEASRARRELELLLPGSTPPYVGGASFRTLAGTRGESLPTRDRAGCCLFYTLRPEDACLTCPRTSDAERIRRMSAS